MHKFFTLSSVRWVTGDLWWKQPTKWKKCIRCVDSDGETCCLQQYIQDRPVWPSHSMDLLTKSPFSLQLVWIIMCSLLHRRHRVNSKSYSECQKCLCAHLIFWFGFVYISSFHFIAYNLWICWTDVVIVHLNNSWKWSFSNNNSNHKR